MTEADLADTESAARFLSHPQGVKLPCAMADRHGVNLRAGAISIGLETKMSYVTAPENIEFFNKADYKVKEEEIPAKLIEILQNLIEK